LDAAAAGFLRVVDRLQQQPFSSLSNTEPDRMKAKTAKAIEGGQIGVMHRFLSKTTDPMAFLPHDAIAIAA